MPEKFFPSHELLLQQFGIKRGAPLADPRMRLLTISHSPHVFFFSDLYIIQPQDRLEEILGKLPNLQKNVEDINGEKSLHLYNLMAIMGHGFVAGHTWKDWKFSGTGKSIDETVQVYESIANQGILPQLDIVIACQETRSNRINASIAQRSRPYISAGDFITVQSPISNDVNDPFKYSAQINNGIGASAVLQADNWFGIDSWLLHNQWWNGSRMNTSQDVPDWAVNPTN